MLKAVQQTVRVGTGGKIELMAPECLEGTEFSPWPNPSSPSTSHPWLAYREIERRLLRALARGGASAMGVGYLLDTHVLLWWIFDDPKLDDSCRNIIADPRHQIWVSSASAWEIATK